MTSYVVGIDRGTPNGDTVINDIVNALKKCAGGDVINLGTGSSVVQNYGLTSSSKGKTGVYITNGVGIATPNDLAQSWYHYDHVIFVWPQYIGNPWMSDEKIKSHVISGEWDWNRDPSWNVGGKTAAQWFSSNSKVDLVAGKNAEDVATRICSGTYVTESGNPTSSTAGGGGSSGGSGSSSGSSTETSNTSPLLQGDMTFEELVGEICNGIDLMFLCKRSTVVVTDFETIFAEAKYLRDNHHSAVAAEDINLWQLEEDSYELNINQHGFYNTVYVEYDKGTVKETFDDFVRVYGEVPIRYKDKKVNKSTAIMKAKAYLAAHLRDLEMTVNATILSEPDIDIGDIVTLNNPKTLQNDYKKKEGKDPEFLFVKGVNTSWEGDGYIESDIELQFSPTSPEKREVPTVGVNTNANSSNGSSSSSSTGGGAYNSCGLSSDNKTICAIGRSSAGGETAKYGREFYRSVFENKCGFCGQATLVWDIFYAGDEVTDWGMSQCKGTSEGGSADGHIFCKNCDADFSTIEGLDHESPPRAQLTRVSGPDKCSKDDAYKLKQGTYSF